MPNFELYQRSTSRARPGTRTLTICKNGVLALSSGAYLALGSPAAVVLLTDKAENLIALRPAEPGTPNAHRIRPAQGHVMSARAFCQYIGADRAVSRRYPLEIRDGLAVADLSKPGTPVTSNRAKAPVTVP